MAGGGGASTSPGRREYSDMDAGRNEGREEHPSALLTGSAPEPAARRYVDPDPAVAAWPPTARPRGAGPLTNAGASRRAVSAVDLAEVARLVGAITEAIERGELDGPPRVVACLTGVALALNTIAGCSEGAVELGLSLPQRESCGKVEV